MLRIRGKVALVAADALLISAAYTAAFLLRLGVEETLQRFDTFAATLPILLFVSLLVHLRYGLFNAILRYASLDTVMAVFKSVLLSVLISCLVIFLFFRLEGLPRSVFIIHAMAALLLIGGARLAVRFLRRGVRPNGDSQRVLLYGTGDAAELALRSMNMSAQSDHVAVGFIDDDPSKKGQHILGAKIHGGLEAVADINAKNPIDEIWVCIPNLAGEELRRVYDTATSLDIKIKILPRAYHSLLGTGIRQLHEPDIADLLRRPPRSLDHERMKRWIRGRRVLITGAGGSIGSELARQVARLDPQALALCDTCESNLFTIHRRLIPLDGTFLQAPYMVDARNNEGVRKMFRAVRPDIVFHAAAYKHVPLVELNPCEGVLTNVQGLYTVALAALEYDAQDFVFISTDKAVRPTSVMGATKRLGEVITQVLNQHGKTRLTAVRFGNVLGSSGSVVPIFQEQIQRGDPVTVTHPDMTRYFMLVSEAVELVIQAGSIGRGGDIFILDMGRPVRIAEMAKDLIRLMGKEVEKDIRIEFTGPRPGEKIHEELLIDPEDSRTSFQDIWIDGEPVSGLNPSELERVLSQLFRAAAQGNTEKTLRLLKRQVDSFDPSYKETQRILRQADSETRWASRVDLGIQV